MTRQTHAIVLLGLLLAGCASAPTEAPVEERVATKPTPVPPARETTTPTTQLPPPTPKPEGPKATTTPVSPPVVETRPLPPQPIQPSTPPAPGKEAKGKPDLTTPGAHKDPSSPLAQRVIYFEFDSAVIDARFQPVIDAHATYLRANPGFKVILQGHADERGSREYNLALGQRRAESVRQALSLLGVADGQMEAVSFGEEKPAVQGSNEEAWRMNRRTEIHYVDE
ncbi:MAG: peptidoglycan-associated lipoprotein Pal [Thiobacillaceae bacterium]|nr:peptidoglycan-associated lipoprotein Pal [Thiobacillaceae bacterium]MDW8324276.1 peptidoglycan-associated lipoprotein Pal [Burkholderiales bacterium]